MTRAVTRRYRDPLDEVWTRCLARLGWSIARTADAYASTDGRGIVSIATGEHLDADDCLAQMSLHEICHALVEAPDGLDKPDWGLDNQSERDVWREHACLRAQAALAAPYGLRQFLAPTTDFRLFYDQLGPDPLEPSGEPSSIVARQALVRAGARPWVDALTQALEATAAIVSAVASDDDQSLYGVVDQRWQAHPSGHGFVAEHRFGVGEQASCGSCAWRFVGGRGRAVDRCRRWRGERVAPQWPACEGWEPVVDCRTCGACCREAYDSVTIDRSEPVIRRHPALVVDRGEYVELRRQGPRCAALRGGPEDVREPFDPSSPYGCDVYSDRPKPCRELEAGGEHCLTARKRVGLSR